MGLDISFNRKAAVEAGLVIVRSRNGDDDAIAIEQANPNTDQGYLNWLQQEDEAIQVPGTSMVASSDGCPDSDCLVIRANEWGRIYAPLTQWLQANNITWTEF